MSTSHIVTLLMSYSCILLAHGTNNNDNTKFTMTNNSLPIPACDEKYKEYFRCQSQVELDMTSELTKFKPELYPHYHTFQWMAPVPNGILSADAVPLNYQLDIIEITSENLNKIHKNAFWDVDRYTTNNTLNFWYDRPIKLRNLPGTEYDLYDAIGNLKFLERLYLNLEWDAKHDVPDTAFKAVNENIFSHLYFKGRYNISRIGANIVRFFRPMEIVDFSGVTSVEKIAKHAFDMRECSTCTKITINLNHTMLSDDSLEPGAFEMTGRVFYLNLDDNNFKFMKEINLKSFLDSNLANKLSMKGNPIDCSTRTGYDWLLNNGNRYKDRVVANCANGESIWEHKWDPMSHVSLVY